VKTGLKGNPDGTANAELYRKYLASQKSRVYVVKDWEDQPRVPAGEPGGGEFGTGGGDKPTSGGLNPSVIGIIGDTPEHLALRDRATTLADSMGTEFHLGDVEPDAQEGIIRSAEAFHEKYPEARFSINTHDMSGLLDYKGTMAVTMAPGAFNLTTSEITLNTAYFDEPGKISKAWSQCTATGFHPGGTGMPNLDNVQRGEDYPKEASAAAAQAVMDHELGHVLGNYVGQDEESSAVYDVADRLGLSVPELSFGVSVYAGQSVRELAAESAASVAGTTPAPAATAIMEEMTKTYNEKAGVGMA
jgi:hypothetical protein